LQRPLEHRQIGRGRHIEVGQGQDTDTVIIIVVFPFLSELIGWWLTRKSRLHPIWGKTS